MIRKSCKKSPPSPFIFLFLPPPPSALLHQLKQLQLQLQQCRLTSRSLLLSRTSLWSSSSRRTQTCLTFSTTTTTLTTTSSFTDSRVKASHLWRPRLALRIPSSSSHLDRPRRSYRPGTRLPAATAYDLGNGGMTGAELGTDAHRVRRGYLGWGNNWEGSDAGSSASDDTTS